MTIRKSTRAVLLGLSAGILVALAGCGGAPNHAPPTQQQTVQSIQNNPHMPPQAKAAALAQIQAEKSIASSKGAGAAQPAPGAAKP